MTNKANRSGSCILAGFALAAMLSCMTPSASAHEANKRVADASALATTDTASRPAPQSTRRSVARAEKGPYYVDFRARTAASWGHAFVWYGKTSEKAVEVAGLTPAGDTLAYVLGHITFVPAETGASYGDLDPEYLTASYRVYLNEADAKRVFAHIRELQANTPVWNAETMNCTGFISDIAEFMGLKVPHRWQRPENFVNHLKEMNGGRQMVRLSAE
ncbi:hypothetical protein [Bradyrhizobium vignae]|uniref:hypothetical protein n=1 Tax=Bradyrhizobium vignae TaxID=1549949 RepID=UPI00100C07E8|nr:hypothetical protein [Bradyrhizobium vignae]RXH05215.1 hypothetical protein EAV90_07410 [Bradyrhizobium vignae]